MIEAWDQMRETVVVLLGLDADELSAGQMSARALVVFCASLLMIRLGKKRFLARATAFDALLAVILGSVVSRAITGASGFFPSLAAALTLVGLHWLFAIAAYRLAFIGPVVKGRKRRLMKSGEIDQAEMRAALLTEKDLTEAVRRQAGAADLEGVSDIWLERSGKFSIQMKEAGTDGTS